MATSTTEIGSSSTANGNGDLALDFEAMFESLKQQLSFGVLINVPDHLRKVDEPAFTPSLISIGPIHYSVAKLQNMKKFKVLLCASFIQRTDTDLNNFAQRIREREKDIRSCYAETVVSSINSDDFVTMIVVDGLFILEYLLRQTGTCLVENGPKISDWVSSILKLDLVLLENQLPFSVLEMLYEQAKFPCGLVGLAFEFFGCCNFQKVKIEHFTDLVRLVYLSERLPSRKSGGAKLLYSATKLHNVGVKLMMGVKFKKMTGSKGYRRSLDISFDSKSGVLEIPCIKLDDEEIRLFQNIIALEQSVYAETAYVTDFFVFLNFLIKTSKDVDLLCGKGILINYLGDSKAAVSTVKNLSTKILGDYMNAEYSKICEDLNASYEQLWFGCRALWLGWWETLWRDYFSTPWRAASTIGAIILLVLTTIQTVCSLKSTKW